MRTMYLMNRRFRALVRVVAVFVITSFIAQDLAFAAGEKAPVIPTISPEYGYFRKAVRTDGGEVIVNIQDAHQKLGAQESITKILGGLVQDYDLSFVSIEGASGPIDTSLVSSFPVPEARKLTGEYLLREGRISAGEFFSMISEKKVSLYGAESSDLYTQNVDAFSKLVDSAADVRRELAKIQQAMALLEKKMYSAQLKDFFRHKWGHRDSLTDMKSHSAYFIPLAQRLSIPMGSFPNLKKLSAVLRLEKYVDFRQAGAQRESILRELGSQLPQKDFEALVLEALRYKQGRITPGAFYAMLCNKADVVSGLGAKYRELRRYAKYTQIYESIDLLGIFEELSAFEKAILARLSVSDSEKALIQLSEEMSLVGRLLSGSLSSRDYDLYRSRSGSERLLDVRTALSGLESGYPGERFTAVDWDVILAAVPAAEEFYELAHKRNKVMLDNTIKRMRSQGVKMAALVTGGFHSEEISKLMSRERLSHLVIMPKFDTDSPDRPYVAILTKRPQSFENVFKGMDSFLAGGAMFGGAGLSENDTLKAVAALAVGARMSGKKFSRAEYVISYNKIRNSQSATGGLSGKKFGQILKSLLKVQPGVDQYLVTIGGTVLAVPVDASRKRIVGWPISIGESPKMPVTADMMGDEMLINKLYQSLSDAAQRNPSLDAAQWLAQPSNLEQVLRRVSSKMVLTAIQRENISQVVLERWRAEHPAVVENKESTPIVKALPKKQSATLTPPKAPSIPERKEEKSEPGNVVELTGNFLGGFYTQAFNVGMLAGARLCGPNFIIRKRPEGLSRSVLMSPALRWYQFLLNREASTRGSQSAGFAQIVENNRVGDLDIIFGKVVNGKRTNVVQVLDEEAQRVIRESVRRGSKSMAEWEVVIDHLRYATGGSTNWDNAQPLWHESAADLPVFAVGRNKRGDSILDRRQKRVFNMVVHNGDLDDVLFDVRIGRQQEEFFLPQGVARKFFMRIMPDSDSQGKSDSKSIAEWMDFNLTQGIASRSVRYAYWTKAADFRDAFGGKDPRSEDVDGAPYKGPTPSEINHWGQLVDGIVSSVNKTLGTKFFNDGAETLVDVSDEAKQMIREEVKKRFLKIWGDAAKSERFADGVVEAFFYHSLERTMREASSCLKGTFALIPFTTLEKKIGVFAKTQSFTIGRNHQTGEVFGSAEPEGVTMALAQSDPDHNSAIEQMFFDNGQFATVDIDQFATGQPIKLFKPLDRRRKFSDPIFPIEDRQIKWFPLNGNPKIDLPTTEVAKDQILKDLAEMPFVVNRVRQSFGSQGENEAAMNHLKSIFAAKAKSWKSSQRAVTSVSPASTHESGVYDLVVFGVDFNQELAETFVRDLKLKFPYLNVVAMNSGTLLEKLKHKAAGLPVHEINPDTIMIGLTNSAQTQSTAACIRLAHETQKSDHVMVVAQKLFNAATQALGQGYLPQDELLPTTFLNLSHLSPDGSKGRRRNEAATIVPVATQAVLTEILYGLIEKGVELSKSDRSGTRFHPFGLNDMTEFDLHAFRDFQRVVYEEELPLRTGHDMTGKSIRSPDVQRMFAVAQYRAENLTEYIHAYFLNHFVYRGLIVTFLGLTAVGLVTIPFVTLPFAPLWIIGALEFTVALFEGWLWVLAVRYFQNRPLFERQNPNPEVYVDRGWIARIVERYNATLFSLAPGFVTPAFFSADTAEEALHRFHMRANRGTRAMVRIFYEMLGRVAADRASQANMVANQLGGIEFNLGMPQIHMTVREDSAYVRKPDPASKAPQQLVLQSRLQSLIHRYNGKVSSQVLEMINSRLIDLVDGMVPEFMIGYYRARIVSESVLVKCQSLFGKTLGRWIAHAAGVEKLWVLGQTPNGALVQSTAHPVSEHMSGSAALSERDPRSERSDIEVLTFDYTAGAFHLEYFQHGKMHEMWFRRDAANRFVSSDGREVEILEENGIKVAAFRVGGGQRIVVEAPEIQMANAARLAFRSFENLEPRHFMDATTAALYSEAPAPIAAASNESTARVVDTGAADDVFEVMGAETQIELPALSESFSLSDFQIEYDQDLNILLISISKQKLVNFLAAVKQSLGVAEYESKKAHIFLEFKIAPEDGKAGNPSETAGKISLSDLEKKIAESPSDWVVLTFEPPVSLPDGRYTLEMSVVTDLPHIVIKANRMIVGVFVSEGRDESEPVVADQVSEEISDSSQIPSDSSGPSSSGGPSAALPHLDESPSGVAGLRNTPSQVVEMPDIPEIAALSETVSEETVVDAGESVSRAVITPQTDIETSSVMDYVLAFIKFLMVGGFSLGLFITAKIGKMAYRSPIARWSVSLGALSALAYYWLPSMVSAAPSHETGIALGLLAITAVGALGLIKTPQNDFVDQSGARLSFLGRFVTVVLVIGGFVAAGWYETYRNFPESGEPFGVVKTRFNPESKQAHEPLKVQSTGLTFPDGAVSVEDRKIAGIAQPVTKRSVEDLPAALSALRKSDARIEEVLRNLDIEQTVLRTKHEASMTEWFYLTTGRHLNDLAALSALKDEKLIRIVISKNELHNFVERRKEYDKNMKIFEVKLSLQREVTLFSLLNDPKIAIKNRNDLIEIITETYGSDPRMVTPLIQALGQLDKDYPMEKIHYGPVADYYFAQRTAILRALVSIGEPARRPLAEYRHNDSMSHITLTHVAVDHLLKEVFHEEARLLFEFSEDVYSAPVLAEMKTHEYENPESTFARNEIGQYRKQEREELAEFPIGGMTRSDFDQKIKAVIDSGHSEEIDLLLIDRDERVRANFIHYLGILKDPRYAPYLLVAIGDESSLVRKVTAEVLRNVKIVNSSNTLDPKIPGIFSTIARYRNDADISARASAIRALTSLGSEEKALFVLDLVLNRGRVSGSSAENLKSVWPIDEERAAVEELRDSLLSLHRKEHPYITILTLETLLSMKTPKAFDIVAEYLLSLHHEPHIWQQLLPLSDHGPYFESAHRALEYLAKEYPKDSLIQQSLHRRLNDAYGDWHPGHYLKVFLPLLKTADPEGYQTFIVENKIQIDLMSSLFYVRGIASAVLWWTVGFFSFLYLVVPLFFKKKSTPPVYTPPARRSRWWSFRWLPQNATPASQPAPPPAPRPVPRVEPIPTSTEPLETADVDENSDARNAARLASTIIIGVILPTAIGEQEEVKHRFHLFYQKAFGEGKGMSLVYASKPNQSDSVNDLLKAGSSIILDAKDFDLDQVESRLQLMKALASLENQRLAVLYPFMERLTVPGVVGSLSENEKVVLVQWIHRILPAPSDRTIVVSGDGAYLESEKWTVFNRSEGADNAAEILSVAVDRALARSIIAARSGLGSKKDVGLNEVSDQVLSFLSPASGETLEAALSDKSARIIESLTRRHESKLALTDPSHAMDLSALMRASSEAPKTIVTELGVFLKDGQGLPYALRLWRLAQQAPGAFQQVLWVRDSDITTIEELNTRFPETRVFGQSVIFAPNAKNAKDVYEARGFVEIQSQYIILTENPASLDNRSLTRQDGIERALVLPLAEESETTIGFLEIGALYLQNPSRVPTRFTVELADGTIAFRLPYPEPMKYLEELARIRQSIESAA